MKPKSYNIEELRCNAFARAGKTFDMVHFQDFMRETHGFSTPHRHNYYMLFLATGGRGSQLIDFKSYPVEAGMMFFMYPGMIHAWEENENLEGYLIFFTADFFAQRYHFDSLLSFPFFSSSRGLPFVQLPKNVGANLTKLMDCMLAEYALGGERMLSALRSLLNVVLIQSSRIYQEFQFGVKDKKRLSIIKQFEQLVDEHFQAKRLVKDYAELLHLSPNYLNVVVKNETGKSAGELIRERIMLEAKRKLTHEGRTVAEIGYDLDFKDTAYFCRFFRKYEGVSPDQFRKNIFQ